MLNELTTVPPEIAALGDVLPTGSRIICDPPVEGTDFDIVLYMHNTDFDEAVAKLEPLEFYSNNDYGIGEENFSSHRRGDINVIVVYSTTLFDAWCMATDVATELNVTDKQDRATLFELIKKYYKG